MSSVVNVDRVAEALATAIMEERRFSRDRIEELVVAHLAPPFRKMDKALMEMAEIKRDVDNDQIRRYEQTIISLRHEVDLWQAQVRHYMPERYGLAMTGVRYALEERLKRNREIKVVKKIYQYKK